MNLAVNITAEHVSFVLKEENRISIADISKIDDQCWYFNRLNVPQPLRGKGYGRELLLAVLAYVKGKQLKLVLEINPWSGADFDLVSLYERYGFVRQNQHWEYS